jgi:hypothetical protein
MDVIGSGFQHVIDSYFWYLAFASVRQCKYVMDKAASVPTLPKNKRR